MERHLLRLALLLISLFTLSAHLLAQTSSHACPKLVLRSPAGITQPGDPMEFRVEADIPEALKGLKFDWKVDGRSFSGQGTPVIQIATERKDANSNITAEVKILGEAAKCSVYLSDSGGVAPRLPNESLDEWGKLDPNDIRGRLDVLFSSLSNNPKYEGVLVLSFGTEETRAYKLRRLNLIYNHIIFRKFDQRRISFFLGKDTFERTVVWQIPAGFDYSEIGIDETKLIKAEEFKIKITKAFEDK